MDCFINLGDLLHRGYEPRKTLELMHRIVRSFRVISLLGNHDDAFLRSLPVSGSDPESIRAHDRIRGSPLLAMFDGMGLEWQYRGMLFVHGGPLERDGSWLDEKFWQRLSRWSGPSPSGYHYTASQAFTCLEERELRWLCIGHQHRHTCCRKTGGEIREYPLNPVPVGGDFGGERLAVAEISLDDPAIIRIGACMGLVPEFGYTDFSRFSIIEMTREV